MYKRKLEAKFLVYYLEIKISIIFKDTFRE
jgi:hypothetical protein